VAAPGHGDERFRCHGANYREGGEGSSEEEPSALDRSPRGCGSGHPGACPGLECAPAGSVIPCVQDPLRSFIRHRNRTPSVKPSHKISVVSPPTSSQRRVSYGVAIRSGGAISQRPSPMSRRIAQFGNSSRRLIPPTWATRPVTTRYRDRGRAGHPWSKGRTRRLDVEDVVASVTETCHGQATA